MDHVHTDTGHQHLTKITTSHARFILQYVTR